MKEHQCEGGGERSAQQQTTVYDGYGYTRALLMLVSIASAADAIDPPPSPFPLSILYIFLSVLLTHHPPYSKHNSPDEHTHSPPQPNTVSLHSSRGFTPQSQGHTRSVPFAHKGKLSTIAPPLSNTSRD